MTYNVLIFNHAKSKLSKDVHVLLIAKNKMSSILKYMSDIDKKVFKRDVASLNDIYEFVICYFSKNNIAESNSFSVNLAIEEIFTNMVKYQKRGYIDIAIELEKVQEKLIITLTDYNVDYFDVSKIPDVDINTPLSERKVGGLGLFLVKKLMDKIDYEYKENNCRIILTKTLEE